MKYLLLIVMLTAATCNVFGQSPWPKQRDSLLNLLSKPKEDSVTADVLLWLGAGYMGIIPDSVLYYAKELGKLSTRIHYYAGMANSLSLQAFAAHNKDEAIALDLKAAAIATQPYNQKVLAYIYNNTATIYHDKGEFLLSLDFYLKASAIFERINDSSALALIYCNIGEDYDELKQHRNSYIYSLKGIKLCRRLHKTPWGAGMLNLSASLIAQHRYDTALVVLHEAKEIGKNLGQIGYEVGILTNINYACLGLDKYDELKSNSEEILRVAKLLNDTNAICYGFIGLLEYYLHNKKYSIAYKYAYNAVALAQKCNMIIPLRDIYNAVCRIAVVQGNIETYTKYTLLGDSINDVLFSDKILKNSQELEAKYSLNKKQAEIDKLNEEKKIRELTLKQRNIINWALAGAVLVIIAISLLYRINYRQKKKLLVADARLQKQIIEDLEKEKQLLAAKAVLQGQAEERTRLAKDLHDGLGGILSSAKYSFSNMKNNLIITPENAAAFERSMGMLDKSINELRRVAHNMMPEALMKFGLDTALQDFCDSIDKSGAVKLTYQSFEIDEQSISQNTAAAIYRIIQELVNNILKHADATTALVQLIRNNNLLSITVEDNGKGFDKELLKNNDGIGYLNLQNRVTYLNGTIDVQTAGGNGTSIHIEIPNITV
jgi:signal transduction histidine kinase